MGIRSGFADTWHRLSLPLAVKAVAQSADADEEAGRGGFVLDFLAQRDDVVVDYTIGDGNARSPDVVEESIAGKDAAALADKHGEQLEFGGGGVEAAAVAAQLEPGEVQFAGAEVIDFIGAFRRSAAQQGAD